MHAPATVQNPHRQQALAHQGRLTKPPGSLGRLEGLAVQLATLQGTERPLSRPASALIFAADHPVTRHQISPYPREVTRAMVANFAGGGAAANVLCRGQDVGLTVIDVGVDAGADLCGGPGALLRRDPVADRHEGDIRSQDAMDSATFEAALAAGAEAVSTCASDSRVLLLGEMGIGNTTLASAVCGALLPGSPDEFVGAGAGSPGPMLVSKMRVVRDAVARVGSETDPMQVLRRLGGRELAALAGAMLCAVEHRQLVVVDGFIVTAVALAVVRAQPQALGSMLFSHRSDEQAHGRVLEALGVAPLLDLGMRLGEATGALCAFPLIESACQLHNEMATFESASVPDRQTPP